MTVEVLDAHFQRYWFLTWTTYGTWLPGDERGFVSPQYTGEETGQRWNKVGMEYRTGSKDLKLSASAKMMGDPIYLTESHAYLLKTQFTETADFRHWKLIAGAIMHNHIHLLVAMDNDPSPSSILRDFKSYGSRALNQHFSKPMSGTWWTEQGSTRKIPIKNIKQTIHYIHNQHHPLLTW